jgi:hypothetical protein
MKINRIVLDCPTCHQTKLQLFPSQILEELNHAEKGFIGVHITKNITCPHEYIIYIDKNFIVRKSSTIDNLQDIDNKAIFELSTKVKNGHLEIGHGPR